MRFAARKAGWQHQAMLATALPKRLVVRADTRARLFIGRHGCGLSSRRQNERIAPYGAPLQHRGIVNLTRPGETAQLPDHFANGVPPCDMASDRRPPDVLTGSAPPSSMRPPW